MKMEKSDNALKKSSSKTRAEIGPRQTQSEIPTLNEKMQRGIGSIYDVYRPLGVVGKYLGIVQLPHLYENSTNGNGKRILMEIIAPLVSISFQCFSLANMIYLMVFFLRAFQRGIHFSLVFIGNVMIASLGPLINLFYVFKLSRRMVSYLKAHRTIEDVLQPRKVYLCRYAVVGFCLAIVVMLVRDGVNAMKTLQRINVLKVDVQSWFLPNTYGLALAFHVVGSVLMTISECQVHFAYILFQHIIKISFEELTTQIRVDNRGSVESYVAIARLKNYRELHQQLCKLSQLLNGLLSPLILVDYLVYTYCTIASTYNVARLVSGPVAANWETVVTSILLVAIHMSMLCVISASATSTMNAAGNVLPVVFSSLDLDSVEAKAEMKLFVNQVKCEKVTFTASGLFKINLGILLTILGAVITYVVIMVQFKYDSE